MKEQYRQYNVIWFWKIHRDALAEKLNDKNTSIININKKVVNGKEIWDTTYAKLRPGVIVGKTGNLYKVVPFETVTKKDGKDINYNPNYHVKYNNNGKDIFIDIDEMINISKSEISHNDKTNGKFNVISDYKVKQDIINKIYDVHINSLSMIPDILLNLKIENEQLKNKVESQKNTLDNVKEKGRQR